MFKFRSIFIFSLMLLISGCKMAILDPKGIIAASERNILILAILLMLLVVIPVIILSFVFAWKYRASNTKATYSPNWAHSTLLEVVWWSIPCVIIAILATVTWISSHKLDPYRPLDVKQKPITIQAIALNWKWLFIYPQQHIATLNFVEIPVNAPIRFLITADAPMNSFAIPQLAGQIYAMTGMQTKLHLMASETGTFLGLSTNFSGEGFSDMNFSVKVTSAKQFNQWVQQVQSSSQLLTMAQYNQLTKDSENNPVEYFSQPEKNLFNKVIMKYMGCDMPGMKMSMSPGMDMDMDNKNKDQATQK